MIQKPPTFEITNADSFEQFLKGIMGSVRRKELDLETADVLAKLSDKLIKHNLTRIMDLNRRNDKSELEFFLPKAKQVMIG